MAARSPIPILAVTQGDAAGVGPEILLSLAGSRSERYLPVLVAERAALGQIASAVPGARALSLVDIEHSIDRETLLALDQGEVPVLDPVAESRKVSFGSSGPADAAAAIACLDAGLKLVREGVADALVTAPVSKLSIASHHLPGFCGHTDYLAEACGLERYGRDYLMAFLAPDLQVALVTTHEPLADAVRQISTQDIVEAIDCLDRHAAGRIAVAGLNPHAGEGGLMGTEEIETVAPAIAASRARGVDVVGPESADSLFARCRRGEFDWALALLHDQGLIAVKTVAFGAATNWTVGLPIIRTSVDHGTAFAIAGHGRADARPLLAVCDTTCDLIAGRLPRRRAEGSPPPSSR
jgi:4-hydroxythreonine-4-phosphate dehydrogenase